MAPVLGSCWFLFLAVLVGIALSVAGLLVVRRYVSHEALVLHHDVAGYMLSVVGTLYAVVLGLMVVGSLKIFDQARLTVEQEANSLHDIFDLAKGLPAPTSLKIRQKCLEYAKVMIHDEWETMEEGRPSLQAHKVITELRNAVITFQPKSSGETNVQAALLTEQSQMLDARHKRLIEMRHEFDPIMWAVLIFGGAVVVVFTYFFGVEKLAIQALMTVCITLVLCLNLVIVALFGYPYSGDVKVPPHAFEVDVDYFQSE